MKVFKIGGNVTDKPEALQAFLEDFRRIAGAKILVHGGGREATELSAALGLETKKIDGRRVTDADTLRVCTMVYAGLVNKRIVSGLQAMGCDAIGMAGCDAAVITSVRRPARPVDFGYVGDVSADSVDARRLLALTDAGLVPVLCAITCDNTGQLLNSNADSVASAVACACAGEVPTELIYCFDQPGVLADIADPGSVITEITPENYTQLRESGAVSDGMLPKIDTALAAVRAGVRSVTIRGAANLLQPSGTTISLY